MSSRLAGSPSPPWWTNPRPLVRVAAVFVLTVLAYLPAIRADFIWNDSDYVTAPALQSVDGLRRIWTEVGATQQYYPLLHTAFWLEHRLWGDAPAGYHIVNILLHATAACLFAGLLRGLGVRGAWLGAVLFALHPVCTESVAWISEQKNTLSQVFFLAAAWAYIRFVSVRFENAAAARRSYRLATAFFVCALLSKTTTATLPAALLVAAWWRRGRIDGRQDVLPLLPWFVLGAAFGLFSAWVEKAFIGASGSDFALSFVQRGLLAGRIVWFYLAKLLWPGDLVFIYPRWTVDAGSVRAWLFPLGLIALLAVAWSLRRRSRAPLAILLLFAGMLFPVLGFFDVYAFMFSFVADHWQYLPCLAVLAGAAALLARAPVPMRAAVVVALGLLTSWQSRMYANMETFYRATLVRNPACWMAHNNLGSLLRQRGRTAEALAHYETALQLKPDSAKAHDNTGVVLRQQHRLNEALHQFEQAVALDPGNAAFQNNLAGTLRETGHAAAALVHHRAAVRLDPEFGAAHNDYGITLRELGRPAEAIAEFEAALRIEPDSAPAHLNLMLSYWLLGRTAEARRHYTAARRLNPALPEVDLDHPPR